MLRSKLLFRFLVVLALVAIAATWTNARDAKKNTIKTDSVKVSFKFSVEDVTFGEKNGYDTVSIKDGKVNQNVLGIPEVPYTYANVLILAGAEVLDVQAESEEMILLAENINLVPVQQPRKVSAKEMPKWAEPEPEIYKEGLYVWRKLKNPCSLPC